MVEYPKACILAGNGNLSESTLSFKNQRSGGQISVLNHTFDCPSKSYDILEIVDLPKLPNPPSFVHRPRPGKFGSMKTPQQLSREAIEEFRSIYEEEFGQRLSDDEVQEIAMRLLRFFGILNQPAPDEEQDQSTVGQ